MNLTKIKFWVKYYFLFFTFRTIYIDHIKRVQRIVKDKLVTCTDIETLNISPEAVRELQIVSFRGKHLIMFEYAMNGRMDMARIDMKDIIFYGGD